MFGFGKKSGHSKNRGDQDEEESSKSRRRKLPSVPGVSKLKKKKKRSDSSDDDGDEFAYDQPEGSKKSGSGSKSKKIKKMRMKMKRKKKANGDDASISSRGYNNNNNNNADDHDNRDRQGSMDYEGDAGFQLDMVPSKPANRKVQAGADDQKKIRVKPFHAFPAPVYMNETGLYNSMMEPSDDVEFLTSYLNPSTKTTRRAKVPPLVMKHFGTPRDDGRVGSFKVEVLGCVGLARAKPEIAVYCVVGDCAFSTDIIQGARSPMWPNSSKRAAVFPLHHAYARLFVGVFDVRQRKNSEADMFCGRIAIDIPQLRPDTEYDITLPLRGSSFIYDRRPRGVVRLRFSLHWFSERAAIMSYLKRPRNPLAFSKQAKKQPTIPCGDPKTFRNVAVTVHGVDFPGKYTRGAFRATMREFNLYQQNIRFLFKVTFLDMILYENPLMSLYLFGCTMHCVWLNSVRLVPPYFVGWLIYMLVENYLAYNISPAGNLGYKPLTILEILKGLVRDGRDKKFNFRPLVVQKRARKHAPSKNKEDEGDIELINHREFPFSERFEYHKFSAAEGIAPSPAAKKGKGTKGTDLRTARRLSIYVAPIAKQEEESEEEEDSGEESDDNEKDEEATMMDQGDDGYGDMDSDDEEGEGEGGGGGGIEKAKLLGAGEASTTRRIRVGPPQNSDTSGRKVPPQVHLSRVEHLLHKASKNISVEHVHFAPPHIQIQLGKDVNYKAPAADVISAKEKQNFDEFDRLLGFRVRNPNPILRITSSFLGPLMRIIRIVIYAVRISFNLTTWRDPFLTFWAFSFLCTLTFVLLIFPWRTFFFLTSGVLLGPQNIAVRRYLERRSKEKEQDSKEQKEREKMSAEMSADTPGSQAQQGSQMVNKPKAAAASASEGKGKTKRMWGRGRKNKDEPEEEEVNEAELYHSPRPAFYAHTRPTRRTQVPRDVAVPYFRFKKDRFFDWPPDPTVSRATPLLAPVSAVSHDSGGGGMPEGSMHQNQYQQQNESSDDDEPEYEPEERKEKPRGMRQRPVRQQKNPDPQDIDYGYG